jgi:hypothetical protein
MAASRFISEAASSTNCSGINGLASRKMQAQRNNPRVNLTPAIVATLIAVAGQAVVLFNDFGAGNNSQSASARMITAAAVSRAGAIEILPKPAPKPDYFKT